MESECINGVRCFAPASRSELMDYALQKKGILVAVNAEKILHADDTTRAIINRNIGYPDGVGAVWGLQKKGKADVVKIPGCELWLDIIERYHNSKTFYLIGGTQEVIVETVNKLKLQYPNLQILNYRNGYVKSEQEKMLLIQNIQELQPEIVFVAMGSPKQELLMEEMQHFHKAVYQGLGGSFDVYTDKVKRAPEWWVKNNLEWAYRLIKQPSRIKRQIHLVKFYSKLKLGKL